jgi:hypothetical protein
MTEMLATVGINYEERAAAKTERAEADAERAEADEECADADEERADAQRQQQRERAEVAVSEVRALPAR